MPTISEIKGREILDSRGQPTLEVSFALDGGVVRASACVPSGASTGSHEAVELRDGDATRFFGKGLLKAISRIEEISDRLKGYVITNSGDFDQSLIEMDGTDNKSHLGANTVLALSMAGARALASYHGQELFEYMGSGNSILPVPMVNVINGGVHADNPLLVQEFMIVPYGFSSFRECIRASSEIFYHLRGILKARRLSTSLGDEGGFAPFLSGSEKAMDLLMEAIKKAGYSSDHQVGLALDVAATEFYKQGQYEWEEGERVLSRDLISVYAGWLKRYPLVSIEDGLSEDDWTGWQSLTQELGQKVQLLGDDLFVTQKARLQKGVGMSVANALLAKINQVGTLKETAQAIELAHCEAYACCLSHRSGETEDSSLADLSVAWGTEQIKTGSVCRGERTAKYNRLLAIEETLAHKADFAGPKAIAHLN